MGYFDSINKKKISMEDTRDRYNARQGRIRNEIISDIKDNLFEPDGDSMKPWPGGGDNAVDRFFEDCETAVEYLNDGFRG